MRQARWWWLLPAAVALAVVAGILITRWSVVLASHPAYPTALLVVALGAAFACVTAFCPPRRRRRTWVAVTGRVVTLLLAALVVGSLGYLRPFGATDLTSALRDDATVGVTETATRIELRPVDVFEPTGVVFWPGARVDARAYLALLRPLAETGHLVVVVKEPFGISFLNPSAATGVIEDHPEVRRWVVGGHSLGGVTAASYADDHLDVDGLLLWASYPLDSLASRANLAVVSVSGTEDGLTTPADIAASRSDLPPSARYLAVAGAVHAFFGDYGPQPGDGTPTTSRVTAQQTIVAASEELLAQVDAG